MLLLSFRSSCVFVRGGFSATRRQLEFEKMAMSIKQVVANNGRSSGASFQKNDGSCASRLAEFFPGALPMHVPAKVARGWADQESEIQAMIEFGTPHEVIITCNVPLEIGESLRISSPNCSLKATAKVVALQVGNENYALAMRFTGGAENWIIQE